MLTYHDQEQYEMAIYACQPPVKNWVIMCIFNSLRPRQNGRHFADDMFKCISLNENLWILIEISLKFVPMGSINNNPALFQIMAWRRPGDKPLSEPMMVNLLTQICVTRPQWVNWRSCWFFASVQGLAPIWYVSQTSNQFKQQSLY